MSHQLVIDSPREVDLKAIDPDDTAGLKAGEVKARLAALETRLLDLQDLLYAAARQSVLIVLQGMDTAGKDGTVKHVMGQVNPMGCHAWSFKAPTPEEQAHDFLWRLHRRTPERGMIAIFNRSYYEDVLVARVHGLVPEEVWRARYEQINQFERLLTSNDTIILKFFLHIAKDEQRDRLLAREDDKDKAWKLSATDWKERDFWGDYRRAYEDVLGKCGTADAPWHIVPANKKWYRNYTVATTLVATLERYERDWRRDLEARGKAELAALREARATAKDA